MSVCTTMRQEITGMSGRDSMESFRQWICEVHIMRLEAKNLSFSYDVKGRQILRQFSLSADSSERVGIIAPSGFGKTTLCKILSGYEAPQSGEVLLDGKPLSEYGATVRYPLRY